MFDNIESISLINGSTFWQAHGNEGEFTQDFFGKFDPECHSYRVDTFWCDEHGEALAEAYSFMGPYTNLHVYLE